MKKETSLTFLKSPIHTICAKDNLRPTFECVHFIKGYAYATDGHILLKQSLRGVHELSQEIVDLLEGKALHYSNLEALKKCEIFEFFEDHILGSVKGSKSKIKVEFEQDVKPVDYEAVIPKQAGSELDSFCFNPELLTKLTKASSCEDSTVKLYFTGEYRGAIVEFKGFALDLQKGLLMPKKF
jgi:hypothetical protein